MKNAKQLLLTCILLLSFSFQTILAQPLFIFSTSDSANPETLKTAFNAERSEEVQFSIYLDSEFIMPTSQQLEKIVTAQIESKEQLEAWMIEPEKKGWDVIDEEKQELEIWMYQPSGWMQSR